jgi:hypothetical protein
LKVRGAPAIGIAAAFGSSLPCRRVVPATAIDSAEPASAADQRRADGGESRLGVDRIVAAAQPPAMARCAMHESKPPPKRFTNRIAVCAAHGAPGS